MHLDEWLLANFESGNFYCMSCQGPFDRKGLIMIGLRKPDDNPDQQEKLYIEYHCPECGQKQGFEIIDMDLLSFATRIIHDAANARSTYNIHDSKEEGDFGKQVESKYNTDKSKKAKKSKSSGISVEEKHNALRMLDEATSWDDWLSDIGARRDRK